MAYAYVRPRFTARQWEAGLAAGTLSGYSAGLAKSSVACSKWIDRDAWKHPQITPWKQAPEVWKQTGKLMASLPAAPWCLGWAQSMDKKAWTISPTCLTEQGLCKVKTQPWGVGVPFQHHSAPPWFSLCEVMMQFPAPKVASSRLELFSSALPRNAAWPGVVMHLGVGSVTPQAMIHQQ